MSKRSLREQLVGAWALTSCVERDIETGVEDHPLGERPLGLILRTPDGYVSAQLQRRERLPFADGDPLRATAELSARIAVVGTGVIGASWAAYFLAKATALSAKEKFNDDGCRMRGDLRVA